MSCWAGTVHPGDASVQRAALGGEPEGGQGQSQQCPSTNRGFIVVRFVRFFAAAVMAISALSTPALAQSSRFLQCVTYARAVSGVELRGNAYSWWDQAEGRYERGNTPRVGAVMAMPSFAGMRNGHVAMVSKVVNDREVLIDHANWSRPGMVERHVRVLDVSDAGDWSRVRVWHAGSRDLGITSYPVSGFIYTRGVASTFADAEKAQAERGALLSDEIFSLAALEG